MPSFKVTALAIVALFTSAQADYYITPTTVPIATRNAWCDTQKSTCPLLCTQLPGGSSTTKINTCDAVTLTYSCVCGTGASPNASEYSQTLPFFICQQWGQQCVAGCGSNNLCQSACFQEHPCGAQNPTLSNVSTTSTVSTAAATGTAASASKTTGGAIDGFAAVTTAASSSTSTKNGGPTALNLGQSYGLAVVLAGVFAGFTLLA